MRTRAGSGGVPNGIRDRDRRAGNPNLTHALNTQRIDVRIVFLQPDSFERRHVGVRGNVVLAKLAFIGRPRR